MIKLVPFSLLVPSLITLSGLVIGISSIKYALLARWEVSVTCLLFAALIDGLDGRIARIMNSSTKFGSELDSLCDLANFGVAPAILVYLWAFDHYEFHLISWGSAMFFTSCIAIRLAKFNISLDVHSDEHSKGGNNYFYGIPAPGAAILILIPIMIEFNISDMLNDKISNYKTLLNLYIIFIAFLAAGNFRTISPKNTQINKEYFSLIMSLCIILFILTIIYPWYIIPIFGAIYLINIPIYIIILRFKKKIQL